MSTRMKHKTHGWHVASDKTEVEYMQKLGWEIELPDETPIALDIKQEEPRKPGRPRKE